jgi:hypothetical protein
MSHTYARTHTNVSPIYCFFTFIIPTNLITKFITILNLSCLLSFVLDEMQMGTGLRANLSYNNHSAENQILPQYSYNKTNKMH